MRAMSNASSCLLRETNNNNASKNQQFSAGRFDDHMSSAQNSQKADMPMPQTDRNLESSRMSHIRVNISPRPGEVDIDSSQGRTVSEFGKGPTNSRRKMFSYKTAEIGHLGLK